MNEPSEAQRLIRLKRYESPGDEFFLSFAEQFKERQRSEMLRRSSRSLLIERISTFFDGAPPARVLLPVGAIATAAIGAGIYFATTSADLPASNFYAGSPALEGQTVDPLAAKPGEDEVIRLKLPRPSLRVPGAAHDPEAGSPLLRASARGGLREL